MNREKLPTDLYRLDARELRNFFRRGLREKNMHDLYQIKSEYERRGLRINQKDYGQYVRISCEQTVTPSVKLDSTGTTVVGTNIPSAAS